jgi:hypothetical protein
MKHTIPTKNPSEANAAARSQKLTAGFAKKMSAKLRKTAAPIPAFAIAALRVFIIAKALLS